MSEDPKKKPTSSDEETSDKSTESLREPLKLFTKNLPTTSGVYLMKNDKNQIIYVGKANNLRSRVSSYFQNSKNTSLKTQYLVSHISSIDHILAKNEAETLLLEASLIKKHRPRYNIRLKDDKSYPYIRLNDHEDYPRFDFVRKVKNDGSSYFGPYTSGFNIRQAIEFINQAFLVRDCSDAFMRSRERPCLTHQIGRCSAPCVDLISKEDYKKSVDEASDFLKCDDKKILRNLKKQMKEASKNEKFEAAARIRDQIDSIKSLREKQHVVNAQSVIDQDVLAHFGDERGTLVEVMSVRRGRVIGSQAHFLKKLDASSVKEDQKEWLTSFLNQYYLENIIPNEIILPTDLGDHLYKLLNDVFQERQKQTAKFVHTLNSERKEMMKMTLRNAQSHFQNHVRQQEDRVLALKVIQERFKLPQLPLRIECYDISHFQGKDTVGSQVVFEEGLPKKSDYRRYKIQSVDGPDDFLSLKEMLGRRLKHTEYEDPDLVVIDGGKGQLKKVYEVFKDLDRLDIPIVALAKSRLDSEFQNTKLQRTEERFFLVGRKNPLTFPTSSEALNILIRIRDEAHNFAISYHKKLRGASLVKSELDSIKGLGPQKKKNLLKKFKSIEAIKKSTLEELCLIEGISEKLAEEILKSLS